MAKPVPRPTLARQFENIQFQFVLLALLAIAIWFAQDFVAAFGAREIMATADLWTPAEWNEAQVVKAFTKATQATGVDAKLETNTNGFHPERRDHLIVVASTKREATEKRQTVLSALHSAFAEGNTDILNSSGDDSAAEPVPNATTMKLKNGSRVLSLAIMGFALFRLLVQFRRAHLPLVALLGILATTFTILTARNYGRHFREYHRATGVELWCFSLLAAGLPLGFAGLVIYLTSRARKAARWTEGVARVTHSEFTSKPNHFHSAIDPKKVASVAYEFTVDSKTYRGNRVSIGLAPAEGPEETLKRFPVGATVPVFYDPENPEECVLDRKLPFSAGCLWGGTIVLLAGYVVAALLMLR